jgi:hypothetical protein
MRVSKGDKGSSYYLNIMEGASGVKGKDKVVPVL